MILVPNTAPKRVRIDRFNATHMNVTWEKLTLEEARGFITGYKITYDLLEARRRRDVTVEVVDPENSFKIITGLGFTESYSVTVSASTAAGDGINSVTVLSHGKIQMI